MQFGWKQVGVDIKHQVQLQLINHSEINISTKSLQIWGRGFFFTLMWWRTSSSLSMHCPTGTGCWAGAAQPQYWQPHLNIAELVEACIVRHRDSFQPWNELTSSIVSWLQSENSEYFFVLDIEEKLGTTAWNVKLQICVCIFAECVSNIDTCQKLCVN